MRHYLVLGLLVIVLCIGSSCELSPPSDPIGEDDVVGFYVPTHSGTETLQIRSDYVWVRSYLYPDSVVVWDSGAWALDTVSKTRFKIHLIGISRRHPDWARSLDLPRYRQRFDGQPADSGWWTVPISKRKGQVQITVCSDLGLYYRKIDMQR